MRAIELRTFGDPTVLNLVERATPEATAGTAIVRVQAATVNPSDIKNIAGRMHQTTLPRIPGRDYAGVVVAGPAEWLNAEVWGTGGDVGFTRDGTFAEFLSVPVASLVRRPQNLTPAQAASLGVPWTTAWTAVAEYGQIATSETIAVLGATGNVGTAAIQIAKQRGARVLAVARREAPDSVAAKLADAWIVYPDPSNTELATLIRKQTDGRGADVILNTIGSTYFEPALGSLAHRGRQIELTKGVESRVSFNLVDFYHNESRLFGTDTLKQTLTETAPLLRALTGAFADGTYAAPAEPTHFPLDKAVEACQQVAAGGRGSIVLTP